MRRRGGFALGAIAAVIACGEIAVTSDGGVDATSPDANDASDASFANDAPSCDGGAQTTISGTVFDPAGTTPLFNVAVYVPSGPLAPLAQGPTCGHCAISGSPLASSVTDATGHFVIPNAPAGAHVPLVIEAGKWRRRIDVSVTACAENPLDPSLTRLPRRRHEASPDDDLPQIAITTGGDDPIECFVRSLGIDDSEFTSPSGSGAVHLYQGAGGATLASAIPSAASFWLDDGEPGTRPLAAYDLIVLGCEGGTFPNEKPTAALSAMEKYTNVGGRVLAMHDQYYWIESNPPPSVWPKTATWNHAQDPSNQIDLPMLIDQSFPRGKALEEWMIALDASSEAGELGVAQAHHDMDTANAPLGLSWLYTNPVNPSPANPKLVEAMSFWTPLTDAGWVGNPCGLVAYWDLHAMANPGGGTFPASCTQVANLTPQQKALEFMFFYVSSCF